MEKKKFIDVEVPMLNKEIELYGLNEKDLEGRHVKLDLTNSLKGKAIEIKLFVKEENKKITTEPREAYLMGYYVRRMMRNGVDYIEDSFFVNCKDHRIKIKPFIITRKRVSKMVLKGLRTKVKEELTSYVKDKLFENIVLDVINNKIQKELGPKLKKIYPLGLFEIKFVGIDDLKEHEKYEQEQELSEKNEEKFEEKLEENKIVGDNKKHKKEKISKSK